MIPRLYHARFSKWIKIKISVIIPDTLYIVAQFIVTKSKVIKYAVVLWILMKCFFKEKYCPGIVAVLDIPCLQCYAAVHRGHQKSIYLLHSKKS